MYLLLGDHATACTPLALEVVCFVYVKKCFPVMADQVLTAMALICHQKSLNFLEAHVILIKHDFIHHNSQGTKQCHIVWQ